MRTEKEILKDIINHINLHSMITWTNKLVDEANDLYKQQSGEQLNKAEVIKSVCSICTKEIEVNRESNIFCDECWKTL